MAKNPATFARRQREMERQKKKREKKAERQERRQQKKEETASTIDDPMQDPTIDWGQSVREVEVDEAEIHQQIHDEPLDEDA